MRERLGSGRRTKFPAARSGWAFVKKNPNVSNGGLHLPFAAHGMCRFEPLQNSWACTGVPLGDAMDGCLADTKKITMELHVNWGHASAQQRACVELRG